jgi:predicted nucleic acid-binding protein
MMLCDTGPIVAFLVNSDPDHARCSEFIQGLNEPLLTTWACLTESMHIVNRAGGWPAQERLWQLMEIGNLKIQQLAQQTHPRLLQLMRKYNDAPMDIADATLVVVAEELNERRIITLDSHFRTYLIHDRFPFDVVP